jgi:hypothetical protein
MAWFSFDEVLSYAAAGTSWCHDDELVLAADKNLARRLEICQTGPTAVERALSDVASFHASGSPGAISRDFPPRGTTLARGVLQRTWVRLGCG